MQYPATEAGSAWSALVHEIDGVHEDTRILPVDLLVGRRTVGRGYEDTTGSRTSDVAAASAIVIGRSAVAVGSRQ